MTKFILRAIAVVTFTFSVVVLWSVVTEASEHVTEGSTEVTPK